MINTHYFVANGDKRANDLKLLLENESYLKTHVDIMLNDSSECLKKVRVDVNTGEGFFVVQVHHLVKLLQER